jgi:hypothetical protein
VSKRSADASNGGGRISHPGKGRQRLPLGESTPDRELLRSRRDRIADHFEFEASRDASLIAATRKGSTAGFALRLVSAAHNKGHH